MNLLVNIDVHDLEKATRFYCAGLGLTIGRRSDGWLADPWGNGFCLLQFTGRGYDEITLKSPGPAPA